MRGFKNGECICIYALSFQLNVMKILLALLLLSCISLLCLFFSTYLRHEGTTDYQLNIHNDTIWLYDGGRFVGKVPNYWNSPLDSLITLDNQ